MLSACAAGPDFKRPAAPTATAYTPLPLPAQTAADNTLQGNSQTLVAAQQIPADWWRLFQSPQLNALIERAFKANPDVEAAQASLRQAQQNVIAQ